MHVCVHVFISLYNFIFIFVRIHINICVCIINLYLYLYYWGSLESANSSILVACKHFIKDGGEKESVFYVNEADQFQ